MLILRIQWKRIIMWEQGQINYQYKNMIFIENSVLTPSWNDDLSQLKECMGMSKNGNGPVNSTYHFRRATGFAQKTMSTNNGTSRSELQ